jgi:ribosomal protein S18 acetylase RimI-like enzyme
VNVRPATEADESVLRELWAEFEAEVPEPAGFVGETWDDEWASLREGMTAGRVLVAEDEDGAAGFLEASVGDRARWHVETVHVRPRSRRQGVATELLRACGASARAAGISNISLGVLVANMQAETVWRRLGFEPVELLMAQSLDALEARLAGAPTGPSKATTHVQSDDRASVERALEHFVPRLARPDVRDVENGWIRIADPLLDSDRDAHSRLAHELSDSLGAVVVALALEVGSVVRFRLYERGQMVDEYLSVPDFYGQLTRGDELAMEANPTVVARLTGASRDAVHRVARTASSPGELPPAEQLYEEVAAMMGLEA